MLWYVAASLAASGANLVASIGLLSLTSFYVYDAEKNIPGSNSEDWFNHVFALVPLTIAFTIMAACTAWFLFSRGSRCLFLWLLIWNTLVLGTCLYFLIAFNHQLNRPKLKENDLFNLVEADIEKKFKEDKGTSGMFIPIWLDAIQNRSKDCCGIRTFRDWEELWPDHDTEVPKSCCKEPEKSESCLTNLNTLPFPNVPSDFIKTGTGCIGAVNKHLTKRIWICFLYLIILSALYAFAEFAYVSLFCLGYRETRGSGDQESDINFQSYSVKSQISTATKPPKGFLRFSFAFLKKKPKLLSDDLENGKEEQGDANDLSGIASSDEAAFGSVESLPEEPEQKVPEPVPEPLQEETEALVSGASSGTNVDVSPAALEDTKSQTSQHPNFCLNVMHKLAHPDVHLMKKIKKSSKKKGSVQPDQVQNTGALETSQGSPTPTEGQLDQAQPQAVTAAAAAQEEKNQGEVPRPASVSSSQEDFADRPASAASASSSGGPPHHSTKEKLMGMFKIHRKDKDKSKADKK